MHWLLRVWFRSGLAAPASKRQAAGDPMRVQHVGLHDNGPWLELLRRVSLRGVF